MKKILLLSIFIFSLASTALADNFTGDASQYTVTVNKVEFYNSTTGSWVLAGEGDMSFNIASASAGAKVGNYMSNASLPAGTYTQIRHRVSRSMTIKGQQTHGASTYYTTASTVSISNGGTALQTNTTGPAAAGTLTIPTDQPSPMPANLVSHTIDGNYFIEVMNLPSSFTISSGGFKKIRISFDVTGVLTYEHSGSPTACWCNPPSVSVTVQD